MKKLLLLGAVMLSALTSWAQTSPYTGVAPGEIVDGESYYLYNVQFSKWLGDNKRNSAYGWTSHAEIDRHGRDIKFIKRGEGWQLDPKLGNNHSINSGNLYMDTGAEVTTWTLTTLNNGISNAVKIKCGNKGLAVNQWGDMDENADSGDGNNNWQIVSRTERLQHALANGTEETPVDISGIVLGGTFPVADDHRGDGTWQGTRGDNASGGDGPCNWNRVWELWSISDRNIYQDIQVPNGKYRVSGKAIYVSTGGGNQSYQHYEAYKNGTEPTKGYLYANDQQTPMCNGYEYVSNERRDTYNTKDLGNGVWTMENTNQFSHHMADSKHVPEGDGQCGNIDVEVTNGTLRVGFKVEGADGAWILINNIDLYCIGQVVEPSIYFANSNITIGVGNEDINTPTTENMTSPTFTWSSSDTNIATVDADGTVHGVAAGEATITCRVNEYSKESTYTVKVLGYTRRDVNGVGFVALEGGDGYSVGETWTKFCDNDLDTKYCGNSGNAWVIIMASEPVVATQYSMVTGSDTGNYNDRNPKGWKLEGSNDLNIWNTINDVKDNYLMKALSKEEYIFQTGSATPYKYFKFSATDGRSGCVQLAEVWINEQPQTFGEPVVENATCKVAGSSKITSDLGAVRTTFIPATNNHNFVDGECTVCHQAATILAANGQAAAYTVKYKHGYRTDGVWPAVPAGNWTAVDFDDSNWDDLAMPVGTYGVKNTQWYNEYNSFYMRREFYLNDLGELDTYTLKTLHDDRYQVYINGVLITEDMRSDNAWTTDTNWIVTTDMKGALRPGKNVIAIYIEQNWGGAYCDFSLERALVNTTPVTVSDAGYATYVTPCKVAAADGVEAYVVSSIEDGYVTLGEVTEIPASVPVVVKATEGTHNLDVVRTDVAALGTNKLQVSATDVEADGSQYILAKVDGEVGFYKATPETTIAAGKGYLVVPAGAKAFMPFRGDATAIEGVIVNKLDGTSALYNLQGQKLQNLQKGINIVNGKKILVK